MVMDEYYDFVMSFQFSGLPDEKGFYEMWRQQLPDEPAQTRQRSFCHFATAYVVAHALRRICPEVCFCSRWRARPPCS